MKDIRSRNFSLISYCSIFELQSVCFQLRNCHYCFICHDKDDSEPHYHIILSFINPRYSSTVLRYFSDFTSNTFIESVKSSSIYDYLLHKNQPEKFQYNIKDICSDNIEFFSNGTFNETKNNAEEIIESIEAGIEERDMLRSFGRDYVLNWHKYHEFAGRVNSKQYDFDFLNRLIENYNLYLQANSFVGSDGEILTYYISFSNFKKIIITYGYDRSSQFLSGVIPIWI